MKPVSILAAVAALAVVTTPARAQTKILCEFPMHLCGSICIAKGKVCPHCRKGHHLCNGHCISDALLCPLRQ